MGFALAGAVVGGALISANASQSAASTEANAANQATGVEQQQFAQTQANEAPYLQAGYGALTQMENPSFQQTFNPSDLQDTPGYQFQLQQGEQAIQQSAAAQGLLNSGATMKALNNYAQGAAGTEYQNAFNNFQTQQTNSYNRLSTLAGLGQTGAQTTASTGAQTAGEVGSNITGAATAQAAGTVGTANAVTGAIGTGMNSWMQQQMMSNLFPNGINGGVTSQNGSQYSSPAMANGGYGVQSTGATIAQ